jgi:hypothetical protein
MVMKVAGWVCMARIYEYKGWIFELSAHSGPWPLKKDWEPRKRAGNVFWDLYSEFNKLSDKEQESYRLGGGCIRF